jgi:hypothetical protein
MTKLRVMHQRQHCCIRAVGWASWMEGQQPSFVLRVCAACCCAVDKLATSPSRRLHIECNPSWRATTSAFSAAAFAVQEPQKQDVLGGNSCTVDCRPLCRSGSSGGCAVATVAQKSGPLYWHDKACAGSVLKAFGYTRLFTN